MKMIFLSVSLAAMGLARGGATTHESKKVELSAHAAPHVALASNSDFVIISAVYGSGVTFSDVTARVDELLRQPNVEFFARPEWLHTDPTPGWNKALVIVYDCRGRRGIFTCGEGGRVTLDLFGK